jgi:hypothetical protein
MQAAVEYTERFNWSVVPLAPRSKFPPKGFKVLPYRERIAKREEIESWWRSNADYNIGLVTGRISGILGIDHDKYNPGYSEAEALRFIPDDVFTPTSMTPRGGQHQFFAYPDEKISIGAGLIPGLDYRGEGGLLVMPPSMGENGKPYKWLIEPAETEPAILPSELKRALINNNIIKNNILNNRDDDNYDDTAKKFFTEGRRNEDIFTTTLALVKQNLPKKLIRQAIETIANNCRPPLPKDEVESVLNSAFERGNRAERNLAADVRAWVLSTNGNFTSTDVARCQQVSTRGDLQNLSMILKRLVDEGVIERYGNKNGCFRRVETELEPLDWKNANTTPLPLKWPFGIENLVNLFPGNIAVIAGAPNAGKTAFILNFIRWNMHTHPIHLFSSEGGPEELRMRLSKFDLPIDEWKFNAWDRSGNFADVIRPDAVNIVDYLELHDDFFKVGGMLKAISDKLRSGSCLIALQKNKGRDEGLGGVRGLEKPRLYLSMDAGVLKIVKGKSWAERENNPNGQSVRFKLVDGCKFLIQSRWERRNENEV